MLQEKAYHIIYLIYLMTAGNSQPFFPKPRAFQYWVGGELMTEKFQSRHGRLPRVLHKYKDPLHVPGIRKIRYALQICLSTKRGDLRDSSKELSPGFFETPVFTKASFFLVKYRSRLAWDCFSDSECFSHKQLPV